MEINNIKITEFDDGNELSGQCGDFRLWYKFPKDVELKVSADPFSRSVSDTGNASWREYTNFR